MPNNSNTPNGNEPRKKVIRVRFNFSWLYLILILGIGWMLFNNSGANPQKIEWAEVQEMFLKGDIKEIDFVRNDFKGNITVRPDRLSKYADKFGGKVPPASPHFIFLVSDKFDAEKEFGELNAKLPADESQVKIVMENDSRMWSSILEWIIFPILLIVMWIWMFRGFNRNMGGGAGGPGGVFNVGKSTGKLADKEKVNVTFKDVAGLYGAKDEVMEIVDFLKNPQKYTALGGKIPKGALLVGPPGTGKTLLAKAVAGEANVPFFSISGSDFVEMFVGVGASRVRDLFRQAKEKAPCIVFIDEIDAVGRARGKNVGFSSNDERENTLNQLLTEMDGFDTNSGVIILAATNRADILDKALLRAGRFDRQIHVDLPELKEREEIFKVHTRNLKITKDFDLGFMAQHTPGFSGADIANVCNEAALTAAEEIINGEPATGALNDLERLTRMAYNMVQYYGMSEKVGEVSFYDSTGSKGYDLTKPYSEKTAELMDQEVKDLVKEIHDRTYKILTEHKDGFVKMAQILLDKEVIFAEDIEKIFGPKVKPSEDGEEPAQKETEVTENGDE